MIDEGPASYLYISFGSERLMFQFFHLLKRKLELGQSLFLLRNNPMIFFASFTVG